jgi:hypothetical protein
MLRLATELLLRSASQLESAKDVDALAQTNRNLFSCLDPFPFYTATMCHSSEARSSRAVTRGHESIVRLLLDLGKVNIDSRNKYGRTPLSNAVEKGV